MPDPEEQQDDQGQQSQETAAPTRMRTTEPEYDRVKGNREPKGPEQIIRLTVTGEAPE